MKTTIAIAALMLFAVSAGAQDQKTPQQRAKARTERLTTVLELTPEQAAKVEALNLKQAQEMEARRKEHEARRDAMRSDMKSKREQHDAEMKAILNAEQYTKWKALTDQQHDRARERRQMKQERKH